MRNLLNLHRNNMNHEEEERFARAPFSSSKADSKSSALARLWRFAPVLFGSIVLAVIAILVLQIVILAKMFHNGPVDALVNKTACVESTKSNVFAFRLHPGDDLLEGLTNFRQQYGIQAGYIITCVGSLTRAAIRLANQPNITIYDNNHFEIVSLVGTLSPAGPHIHISISDGTGQTIGGHLAVGSKIYTTAEIVIGDATELVFTRPIDPQTTYDELQVECKK